MIIAYSIINCLLYIAMVVCVYFIILEYEFKFKSIKIPFALLFVVGLNFLYAINFKINFASTTLLNSCFVLVFLLITVKGNLLEIIGSFFIVNLCIFQITFYLDVFIVTCGYIMNDLQVNFLLLDTVISALLLILIVIVSVKIWNSTTLLRTIKSTKKMWFIIIELITFVLNSIFAISGIKLIMNNQSLNENGMTIIVFS